MHLTMIAKRSPAFRRIREAHAMIDDRDVNATPENAGLLALTDKLRRQLEHQWTEKSRVADDDCTADGVKADGVKFELIAETDGIAVEFKPGIDHAREAEICAKIAEICA